MPQKTEATHCTAGSATTDKSNRLQTIDNRPIRESIIKKNAHPLNRKEGVFLLQNVYVI